METSDGDIAGQYVPGLLHSSLISGVTTCLVGDDRSLLAEIVGTPESHLVMMKQVHGDVVHVIDNAWPSSDALLIGDALITQRTDVVLCVKIADCAGILLWDEASATIGCVHSGWRGTHSNIVSAAVRTMVEQFSTNASSIKAFISPCASAERYEVQWDVAQHFPDFIVPAVREPDRWLFDNRSAIIAQLEAVGIDRANICVEGSCTIAHGRFHSFRRDGAAAGRCVAFIGLRSFEVLVPL